MTDPPAAEDRTTPSFSPPLSPQQWPPPATPLISAPFAPWLRRAQAFLFDLLVQAVLVVVCAVVPYILIGVVLDASGWAPRAVYEVGFILSIGLLIGYPVYFIAKRGQTPGMKLLQIRLYRLETGGDPRPPTYKTSWGRWAIMMVLNLLSGALFGIPIILDYLWASWDKRGQCLHDKAVGTVAIDERGRT